MVIFIFGESITNCTMLMKNYDFSTICVREKNASVPSHSCTDTDTQMQEYRHWYSLLGESFTLWCYPVVLYVSVLPTLYTLHSLIFYTYVK